MRRLAPILATLLLLLVVYVLSYAPVYRWHYGSDRWTLPLADWETVFVPVHFLIDETPLREPLLRWAALWGTRRDAEIDIMSRRGFRRYR